MRTRVVAVVMVLGACASGGSETTAETTSPRSTTTLLTVTVESTPGSSESPSVTTGRSEENMRGRRYCEILLLNPSDSGIRATVFNTYPLNDCPNELWAALDPVRIALQEGVAFAFANGPRVWLMNSVERDPSDVITKSFDGIDMNRYATVDITDPTSLGRPYTTQRVDRKSRFYFEAGEEVYVVKASDGRRFVMQSFSQQVDPTLSEADLALLANRLNLPPGWSYEAIALDSQLVVGLSGDIAEVLQDDLQNSYSLVDGDIDAK